MNRDSGVDSGVAGPKSTGNDPARQDLAKRDRVESGRIGQGPTGPDRTGAGATGGARLVEVEDDLDAINALYLERRWGDGLPVVPPTVERVEAMLGGTDRKRDELVAVLAPGFGAATVERIAVNAVLAGCRPSYLPVLIAAVEAIAEPHFNLQGIQATTNPVAVMLVVNGPAARQLGVQGSYNCLGQGWPANATLGRALRLVMQNVGKALPGEMDRATQGQPGKISFCCAENEAASPWEPLHVERGFAAETSTVTVIGVAGTLNMNTHAKDADDLLRVIADTMTNPTSNDYWIGGEPWVMLAPEHAEICQLAGMSKADVKRRLWEGSHLEGRRLAAKEVARFLTGRGNEFGGVIGPDTRISIAHSPDLIGIMVAGGPGTHSVYLPGFGDTRSVTRPILDAAGQPIQQLG